MKTSEFVRVLHDFPLTSIEEAQVLLDLKENFPFSQLLHTLSARVSKDHNFTNHQTDLQLAAVYSADRGVLKTLMETGTKIEVERRSETASNQKSSADMANTLLQDLAKLHQLRQNFELMFTDGPVSTPSSGPLVEASPTVETEPESSTPKSKKERIVQLAKALATPVEETVLEVEPGFKSRKRKKDAVDSLIDQIATSKKEIIPETEKHKEQIKLIDQFIKIQPSITGGRDKQAQNSDLSTIKTGEFGDNIISETLVEILLKQGKKEKALEVLKKLIWKFPQKKAYFAAQIEELRK